ncbi:unnamed protein product [Rotaria sordida]|uniref:EGF-like domain-containing protein n=1 Tax=Rotaria sordida TaxID=392033 RepID=A0A815GYC1_9BILA|nr:unnamed protein product [Rotaria sordida]
MKYDFNARCVKDEQSDPGSEKWTIKYLSNTNGGKYDRSINAYEFDTTLYETESETVKRFENQTGYVFCTGYNKGIEQLCPPGTEMTFRDGGCFNKTTNTRVYPAGSRCALKPCQNGGHCYDLSSADAYHCACSYPYTGVHCQTLHRLCYGDICSDKTSNILAFCHGFTTDKALPYVCLCHMKNATKERFVALNNCHSGETFHKVCDGKEPFVGALPFTNKAFYICLPGRLDSRLIPCDLDHVWNDTQKECVPEYTLM